MKKILCALFMFCVVVCGNAFADGDKTKLVFEPNVNYSGVVVDENGAPLEFVAILSDEDRTNSSYYYETDENGKFLIPSYKFPENASALFSLVGCKDKTVKLSSSMRVVMECGYQLDESQIVDCAGSTLEKLKASAAKYNPETDKCEATTCVDGAYFVYDKDDVFQGYCEDNSYCGNVMQLVTDGDKTKLVCEPIVNFPDDDIEIVEDEIVIEDDLFKNLEETKLDIKLMDPDHAKINACNKKYGALWNKVLRKCQCADEKNTMWNSDETACVERPEVKLQRVEAAIANAVSKLDSSLSDLDVSKWKSADGTFNTARLASDTIAGVVLGAAGGLITSHVVKKHQVEEGFEDIKCVIGGQGVAGWGDEFNVGIQ